MNLRRGRLATALLLGSLMVTAVVGPAAATTVGTTEGCTPGYWKQSQHFDSWQEYSPTTLVSSVFTATAGTSFGNETLLQALQGSGGSGITGKRTILLRAAVAALLNSAYDPLYYPWQRDGSSYRPPLLSSVNTAFNGTEAQMTSLASWLDRDNNLGCPLS